MEGRVHRCAHIAAGLRQKKKSSTWARVMIFYWPHQPSKKTSPHVVELQSRKTHKEEDDWSLLTFAW